ncbi:MAG: hypothetical protein R2911_27870 [Caldilineaceae bacterium]
MTIQTLEQEAMQETTENLDLLMELVSSLRKNKDSALLRLDKIEKSRLDNLWQNICARESEPQRGIFLLEFIIESIEIMEKFKADPTRVVTGAEMRERMAARGVVMGNAL